MNEKVTLHDLIEALALRHQMDSEDADAFVKAFFELIRHALEQDKYVKIKGLGTFKRIEIETRTSADEEGEERTEMTGRFKVTFTPDVSMRDLINKPFAHFETVVLNENTHFDDMSEEVENPAGKDEPESIIAEEISVPDTEPLVERKDIPESEQTDAAETFSKPETKSVEKTEREEERTSEKGNVSNEENVETDESEGKVVAQDESDFSVMNEKPDEERPFQNEAIDNWAEKGMPVKVEKNKVPWCMLATILLVGVFIGGGVIWALLSGRRYIPETLFRELVSEKKVDISGINLKSTKKTEVPEANMTATSPVKEDSVRQEKDTALQKKAISLTLPVAGTAVTSTGSKSQEKVGGGNNDKSQSVKRETLADTVEYTITGTMDTYTIQNGESLVKIALKYYGNKKLWPYIVRHNRKIIKNPDNVPVGTTLQIPKLTPKKK